MDVSVMRDVASEFLPLSGLHHLALVVICVIAWARRSLTERVLGVYFAVAFATAAFALFSRPGTRAQALLSAALCVLWISQAVVTRGRLSFARTPRPRLAIMALAGAFALSYPGYSEGLPPFIFSPLGVILPPTVLAATALLNASCEPISRTLHWSLAGVGLLVGGVGLVVEGWIHVPLVLISAYAVPLLLGRGRLRPESDAPSATSVRAIRDRMYSRRSILQGPRDTRRQGRSVRIRRRR